MEIKEASVALFLLGFLVGLYLLLNRVSPSSAFQMMR